MMVPPDVSAVATNQGQGHPVYESPPVQPLPQSLPSASQLPVAQHSQAARLPPASSPTNAPVAWVPPNTPASLSGTRDGVAIKASANEVQLQHVEAMYREAQGEIAMLKAQIAERARRAARVVPPAPSFPAGDDPFRPLAGTQPTVFSESPSRDRSAHSVAASPAAQQPLASSPPQISAALPQPVSHQPPVLSPPQFQAAQPSRADPVPLETSHSQILPDQSAHSIQQLVVPAEQKLLSAQLAPQLLPKAQVQAPQPAPVAQHLKSYSVPLRPIEKAGQLQVPSLAPIAQSVAESGGVAAPLPSLERIDDMYDEAQREMDAMQAQNAAPDASASAAQLPSSPPTVSAKKAPLVSTPARSVDENVVPLLVAPPSGSELLHGLGPSVASESAQSSLAPAPCTSPATSKRQEFLLAALQGDMPPPVAVAPGCNGSGAAPLIATDPTGSDSQPAPGESAATVDTASSDENVKLDQQNWVTLQKLKDEVRGTLGRVDALEAGDTSLIQDDPQLLQG